MPPVRRTVGNMVNTRGDRQHDCHVDDCLVYSPYNVHSPEKRPLCSFAGGGDTLAHYPYRGRCGMGKYYVGQKP